MVCELSIQSIFNSNVCFLDYLEKSSNKISKLNIQLKKTLPIF